MTSWPPVLPSAVAPYYLDDSAMILHGRCEGLLPCLQHVDVVITDPPYDARTHAGARTTGLATRQRASFHGLVPCAAIEIGFEALESVRSVAALTQLAQRWCVVFCSVETLGAYQAIAGPEYIRGGFWRRTSNTPQISGDRPGQPGEGIAILHRVGKKHWNGGGYSAYYKYSPVKRDRVHPTQKPEGLILELVSQFSDQGEVVLDPYMGSGTTGVACRRLGRRFIGIEQNEEHCETAVKRLRQIGLFAPSDFEPTQDSLL